MKVKFLLFLSVILISSKGNSQTPNPSNGASQETQAAPVQGTSKIEFEKLSHDFSTVNEGGPITYEFKFTNKGSVPLVISNARASCGCTTPTWTSEPVPPGKTGTITAQYNTANRPGAFTKTITVVANTEPAMTVLTISGNVLPKVKKIEEQFPKKVGNLRMVSDHIYIGKITTKEPSTKEFQFYNDGTQPITLSAHDLPSFIEVSFFPQTLAPKEKSTVKVTYNALKKNELGPVEDKITIHTNEASDNKVILNLVTDINEYYPPVSGVDAENAPKVIMNKSVVDFTEVKPNSMATEEVEISNPGKQDLVLKKIRTGAPYINIKPEKAVVKAGQTIKLKITYKAENKTGPDSQYVWIYSNDPSRPTQNFTVKANVIQ